ncbi:MAG: FeoB-associated Cys-rich membrane protein [Verrucomicrobiae bacterium]|nr:FeoB-associated Cys-rich membrane protein [Verrucomicrobiae bacterium]
MQEILVGLAIGASVFWLVRRAWRARRSPCGGCSGCGSAKGRPAVFPPTR